MLRIGKYLPIMDKETLIKLATAASIFVLALSILTAPLVSNADVTVVGRGEWDTHPIFVKLVD